MTAAYLFLALAGLCVGSFCNVLILRIPRGEEFVKTPSHCMACGHALSWRDMIPVASWLFLRGRCRYCGASLSAQYPLVEGANAAAWLVCALAHRGDWTRILLCCALSSLLLVLAVIDWRTFEIPNGINLAIALLGLARLATAWDERATLLIGALAVSVPFFALWWATGGAGLGLGDVKLMAAAGLFLGWPCALFALLVGSVLGSVIHLWRMRHGAGRKLAFGPYLAGGIWVAALFGEPVIRSYLSLLGL